MLTTRLIPAATLCCTAAASAAQFEFRLWFEGPSDVVAGESATLQAWASVSGPGLEDSELDALASIATSIRAQGDLDAFASFEPALSVENGVVLIIPGTPDRNTLVDIVGMQFFDFNPAGPNHDNPMHLFDFEVQTRPGQFGMLTLDAVENTSAGAVLLIWKVNSTNIWSNDTGNSLTIDPFSFQVIPAPASLALLALAGLGAARRRR